jgi:hypothetical protein
VSVSLLYEVMMAEYVKLGPICFSMASAISLWRPMQMRGIGCDMAMSDVEERRGLKITPESVGARNGKLMGLLTLRKMSYFFVKFRAVFYN